MVLSSADFFFKISFFVVVFFLKKFGNISRVSNRLDPDHRLSSGPYFSYFSYFSLLF